MMSSRVPGWLLLTALLAGCAQQPPDSAADSATDAEAAKETSTSARVSRPADASDFAPDDPQGPGEGLNRLSRKEIDDGWVRLFDGKTMFGWSANSETNWHVADGTLTADAGGPGLLVTTSRFADYEFRCDFKLEKGGNSGVFLRTAFQPTDPAIDCYELNICDTHDSFPTGGLVKRVPPGVVRPVEGEWHTFHVRLAGPEMEVLLDGDAMTTFTDETDAPLQAGLIGLQMNGGEIAFRNVFLKPLSTRPLLTGGNIDGWHQVPGSKSTFELDDQQVLHVKNGPGFLESDGTWGDFVLQAQAISHGTHLNSGIFFRAMDGTAEAPSNGYELQIQNGFKDADRTAPLDFGTGAIFRRVPARRVVPDDNQWFIATLVADGPHFSVWIDGFQVTDWTDERPADPNPRQGLRLEPGHLILQGHDPTTDLSFKNIRVAELPESVPGS